MADPIKQKTKNESDYYSHILINKTLRLGFTGLFLVITSLVTIIIMRAILSTGNWIGVVLPVLLFGVPIMIYPPIEYWIYQPWQARTQKYERHYLD